MEVLCPMSGTESLQSGVQRALMPGGHLSRYVGRRSGRIKASLRTTTLDGRILGIGGTVSF